MDDESKRSTPLEAFADIEIGNSIDDTSLAERKLVHRIGGRAIENLRLKAKEKTLDPPGISVILSTSARAAAEEMRQAFPNARKLHEQAKTVASATIAAIRSAGFDVIPKTSRLLPNHCRLIHPNGVAGFGDENLARLSEAFHDSTEIDP